MTRVGVSIDRDRARFSCSRVGTTLIETIVVLSIVAGLLAILLPAVQRARLTAMDTACKNNLRQLAVATRQYSDVKRKLPEPAQAGTVSGWAIAILPFMEERLLAAQLAGNPSVNQQSIAPLIRHRPRIMTCPFAWEDKSDTPSIATSHYGFVRTPEGFYLRDLPLASRLVWVQSPEVDEYPSPQDEGPHAGGYYKVNRFGAVVFLSNGL
jgi:type II secretory pathway pseudopilin PulG